MKPKGWNILELNKVAKLLSGGTPSKANPLYWEGNVPWVTVKDLKHFRVVTSGLKISTDAIENGTRLAPIGSTLVLVRGMTLKKDVPVGYVEKSVCFNQDIKCLVPQNIHPEYLAHYLDGSRPHLRAHVIEAGHGTGVLPTEDLESFLVAVPAIDEQRAISAVINQYEQLVNAAEHLLTSLVDRRTCLMQQLLTGKRRFSGFTKLWRRVRMSDILHEDRRQAPWSDSSEYSLISVRRRCEGLFLRMRCLGSEIETKKLFSVKSGDFLVSIKQVAHGAMAIVTPEFNGMHVSDSYVIFAAKRKDVLDISFFSWLTKMPWIRHLAAKASHGVHIEKMFFDPEHFLKQEISIPESIEEQRRISAFLHLADREIDLLEKLLAAYRKQKKGMMQQLLTGKRRVKVQAA